MNKIYRKDGCWFFDDYFDFMEANKSNVPESIRNEVLNPKRYMFNTPETLYDSWLMDMKYHINILEEELEFTMTFLSPFQNQLYKFQFYDVKRVRIPKKSLIKEGLVIHQFGFHKKGRYFYEFTFSNEERVRVIFKGIKFSSCEVVSDIASKI